MTESIPKVRCTRAQVREAAVWMTLLRGPERSEKLERGFHRWLSADPAHQAAFEKVSTVWEETGALPRGPIESPSRWQRAGFRQGFMRAGAAVAALALLTFGLFYFVWRDPDLSTGVGEQRLLVLDDGTRVYMNTNTRLFVAYDERHRKVVLKNGEALFEVAKRGPQWPFLVQVGKQHITALGTAFVVRSDAEQVSVTLLEGKVSVSGPQTIAIDHAPANFEHLPRPSLPPASSTEDVHVLAPGQRLTLEMSGIATSRMDAPELETVTAWRVGRINMQDMPLADAVAEMNRYSREQIVIEHPRAAALLITGVFRTGDTLNFANAVARSYGLQVLHQGNTIKLAGEPRPIKRSALAR